MIDPIATIARAAASRLTDDYGQGIAADVESALHTRRSVSIPDEYLDPVALGSLIVSIATLAWTVYTDRKGRATEVSPDAMARTIHIELPGLGDAADHAASRDRMIQVIVSETLRVVSDDEPDRSH